MRKKNNYGLLGMGGGGIDKQFQKISADFSISNVLDSSFTVRQPTQKERILNIVKRELRPKKSESGTTYCFNVDYQGRQYVECSRSKTDAMRKKSRLDAMGAATSEIFASRGRPTASGYRVSGDDVDVLTF